MPPQPLSAVDRDKFTFVFSNAKWGSLCESQNVKCGNSDHFITCLISHKSFQFAPANEASIVWQNFEIMFRKTTGFSHSLPLKHEKDLHSIQKFSSYVTVNSNSIKNTNPLPVNGNNHWLL